MQRLDLRRHIIFHEVLVTSKQYMRDVSAIDPAWLPELAPHFYSYKNKALNPTGPKQEGDFEEGTNKRRKLGPVIERLT